MTGIRKSGRVNRLEKLMKAKGIPYKRRDLEAMGLRELSKKIQELDPKAKYGKANYRWRGEGNEFGR